MNHSNVVVPTLYSTIVEIRCGTIHVESLIARVDCKWEVGGWTSEANNQFNLKGGEQSWWLNQFEIFGMCRGRDLARLSLRSPRFLHTLAAHKNKSQGPPTSDPTLKNGRCTRTAQYLHRGQQEESPRTLEKEIPETSRRSNSERH